ncbi:unnamed protein product [Lepeophtheirus salmonis]|uniref:(salmon louse) hypothetical protein n=1 Tax=Lepeophtheirus salmonis TaxID=72036 RepID=A0A7R8CPS1_LEPSM|nr:unnamed protein product [Lepeophtheirus salmonis]CAF2842078.1 unnamed protein product [Lepeophtheirus salmonis]
MVDRSVVFCKGQTSVCVELHDIMTKIECLISINIIRGVDSVIGTYVLRHHRKVIDNGEVRIYFKSAVCFVERPAPWRSKEGTFQARLMGEHGELSVVGNVNLLFLTDSLSI